MLVTQNWITSSVLVVTIISGSSCIPKPGWHQVGTFWLDASEVLAMAPVESN